MKKLFSWRLPLSDDQIDELWRDATFVFDTNFLLDLYRVSRTTAEDYFKILDKLKDRIWLPHQVASEFIDRREEEIEQEANSFKKALSELEKWKEKQRKIPSLRGFLSKTGRIVSSELEPLIDEQEDYFNAVDAVVSNLCAKIKELEESHSSLSTEKDFILDRIDILFDEKIGQPYGDEDLQRLYQEGERRYEKKIPPGYEDAGKKGDRKYGDLVAWKQILDFAARESRSIVLVTGEKKEDWWKRRNGKVISPREELRHEFQQRVGDRLFWMYRTQFFLETAKDRLGIEIDPRTVEETDAISQVDSNDEAILDYIKNKTRAEQLNPLSRMPEAERQKLLKLANNTTIAEQLNPLSRMPEAERRKLLELVNNTTIAELLSSSLPKMSKELQSLSDLSKFDGLKRLWEEPPET